MFTIKLKRSKRFLFAILMLIAFPYIIELMFSLPGSIHNYFVPNASDNPFYSLLSNHTAFETIFFNVLRVMLFMGIIVASPDNEVFEDLNSGLVPVNNAISPEQLLNFSTGIDVANRFKFSRDSNNLIFSYKNSQGNKITDTIAHNLKLRLPDPIQQKLLNLNTFKVINDLLQPQMDYVAVPLLHIYPKDFVWQMISFLGIGNSASFASNSEGKKLLLQMFNKSSMIQQWESTLAFMKQQARQQQSLTNAPKNSRLETNYKTSANMPKVI